MALIIRKNAEGARIEGEAPEEHIFSVRHLEREIESELVEVFVTFNTTDGPVTYQIEGFVKETNEETGEETSNHTAWIGKRVKTS